MAAAALVTRWGVMAIVAVVSPDGMVTLPESNW